jgi:putative transposase
VPAIGDQELLGLIRQVLVASPFAGEGYRKVRARLRREHGVHVSGKRVVWVNNPRRVLQGRCTLPWGWR